METWLYLKFISEWIYPEKLVWKWELVDFDGLALWLKHIFCSNELIFLTLYTIIILWLVIKCKSYTNSRKINAFEQKLDLSQAYSECLPKKKIGDVTPEKEWQPWPNFLMEFLMKWELMMRKTFFSVINQI